MSKQAATQDKGTNIQVVVRCRGKNERERKENSPTVIDVPQIRGKELTVRGTATTRQYHFDRVFGPQADQELVYREIVSPILDEVMQGYNCTIFAYGQTGTGKTYTMEGDMDLDGTPQSSIANTPQSSRVPTPANFSSDLLNGVGVPPHSGIIPRTLRRLFYALDKLSAEYYVHVSYLELYNEELRDLLAGGDINDELNNPRAMNGFEHSSNLKIYESGTDKGVIVQGLEEKIVTNAHDAISLMQTGSLRRKVAATRCNDASSRSHAIFTITVFIRERAVTVEGEDIVKLGKLNLVDLAGSENIGRSGAENIRAREAANINKSLLTLGRVINALVEKHSHVPYRDSKLTRILKDSLGGRTRTCLIATISPAKANVEETLKTLDYANQAKSIRNKPEANKKVSKSDIVNDMQMYIERLRNDLEAARDSNGFFVTKETYEELTTEAKESKKLVDEWKQRVAIWEEEMKHLSHQKFISRAHAKHESALDSTARLLYSSLSTSSRDAAELHSKIARMSERERLNLQAVAQISQLVGSETKRALDSVAEYNNNADTQTKRLLSTLQERVGESFEAAVAGKIREYEDKLNTQISGIVERALESGVSSRAACKSSIASVEELLAGLKTTIDGLAQECVGACTDYASEVQEFSNRQTESITARTENINSLMATCVSDLTALLSESQANAAQIITNLASEIEKLELQNQQMTRDFESKIESFKSRSEKADSSLLQKVKAMIEESREQEAAALQDLLSMTQSQSASSISNANGLLGHTKTVGDGVAHLSRSLLSRVASAQTAVQDSVEAEGRASLKLIESLIKSSKAHGKAVTKGFKSAQGGVASVQERAADVEAINIKHLDALYETL
ncbi:Kinesin- motor protein, partial [Dipsacomyces acuminosporus]